MELKTLNLADINPDPENLDNTDPLLFKKKV